MRFPPEPPLAEPTEVIESDDDRAIDKKIESEERNCLAIKGESEDCERKDGGVFISLFHKFDVERS